MTRHASIPIFVIAIISCLFCVNCSIVSKKAAGEDFGSSSMKVITSSDKLCQLTVPGNWSRRNDLNADASLQVGDREGFFYAMVISEDKQDFRISTVDGYAKIIIPDALQKLEKPSTVSEPTRLSINGNAALQYEIRGPSEKFNLV